MVAGKRVTCVLKRSPPSAKTAKCGAFSHKLQQQASNSPMYTVSKKASPTFLTVTRKLIIGFWQFLVWIFLTQLAIKWPFSFPPHPTFVSALPGESTTSEISLFYPMRYDCLINITRKNTFCSHFWHFGWHFIQLSILLEVLAHYANTGHSLTAVSIKFCSRPI